MCYGEHKYVLYKMEIIDIMKESDYRKSGISYLLIHIYLGYVLSNSVIGIDANSLIWLQCYCYPKATSNTIDIVYIN